MQDLKRLRHKQYRRTTPLNMIQFANRLNVVFCNMEREERLSQSSLPRSCLVTRLILSMILFTAQRQIFT